MSKRNKVVLPLLIIVVVLGWSALGPGNYVIADAYWKINRTIKNMLTSTQDASTLFDTANIVSLPQPQIDVTVSVEKALNNRRSRRQFKDEEISLEELSQILWASYGITIPVADNPSLRGGLRTAPSAGALYPLEIYIVVGKVRGIEPGVYKYLSQGHKIVRIANGDGKDGKEDVRSALSSAALGQEMIKDAPVSLVYTAVPSRTTGRYGKRGQERYIFIESGHSAENVYLQVEALGLGTCAIGAFSDVGIAEILKLPREEEPLYIMPIGRTP